MTQNDKKQLTNWENVLYIMIGFTIAVGYTFVFIVVSDLTDDFNFSLIPVAHAQIQPFEQQLQQIRDPEECTRKVVQGRSAEIPFVIKVIYDTTRNRSLTFIQQGTSFPVTQATNQVMTFYTNGTDQYQIKFEMNYPDAKERQVYIEYLVGGQIVQSEQEKFDSRKFCMTIFANTILPPRQITKEEIFGESLDYVRQIPNMINAFNINTVTQSTAIAYMWMLILGVLVVSVLTFITSISGNRKFDSKMRDVDDVVEQGSAVVISLDGMVQSVSKPLQEVSKDLKAILNLPQVKEQLERVKPHKESKLKAIIKKQFKKKEDYQVTVIEEDQVQENESFEDSEDEQQSETEENQSEVTKELTKVEQPVETKTEEKPPEPEIELTIEPRPAKFKDIVDAIDYKNKQGKFEPFTYNELLLVYTWIQNYNKRMKQENKDIPEKITEQQKQIMEIIYYAIFRKMEKKMSNGK